MGRDSLEFLVCFENLRSFSFVKNRGPELHGASGLLGGSHWHGARFGSAGVCPSNGSSADQSVEGGVEGALAEGVEAASSESSLAEVVRSLLSRLSCSSSESVSTGLERSLA